MKIRIALIGNPNCGKTTLFNCLTGSNQYVGNWPGVTIEKKEGALKGDEDVRIQDLPGIYSLSPYSPEETVTRRYLVQEHPDAILNVLDGTNLERNLYLTTQLLELGYPVVAAVNMIDLVRKKGDSIDLAMLGRALGCEVMEVSAMKGEGCGEAAARAVDLARAGKRVSPPRIFSRSVERALTDIEKAIEAQAAPGLLRWYAVKLFERDKMVREELKLAPDLARRLEDRISECEAELKEDSESILANQRYDFICRVSEKAVKKKVPVQGLTRSDRIDRIVTDRVLALPIFTAVMFLMYAVAVGNFPFSVGTICADWANRVLFGRWIPGFLDGILTGLRVSGWLYSLIMDGIVAGVGAVLGFVPQILVLSLLLSILEDVGYMSRVAFIMDRILRRFGLSGKSIIPMLIATGCGVPGILASRTITEERDRRITVMTTGFIPCGAKMPIVGLFAGALFGNSPVVAVSAFFIGAFAVMISGVILKKFRFLAGKPAAFVMELPPYHMPSAKNVLRAAWDRGMDFVKRAVTIVLLSSVVVWFLLNYGFVRGAGIRMVTDSNASMLASLGKAVAWLFYPLGWAGDMAWKAVAATATGLIAKEEVVMTLGTLYNFAGELSETGNEIWTLIRADFGPARAYSFLIFNLLCAPCIAAIGAIRREMGDLRWTIGTIVYMSCFAYAASMIVFQLAGLFTGEAVLGTHTFAALAVLAGVVCLVFRRQQAPDPGEASERRKADAHGCAGCKWKCRY